MLMVVVETAAAEMGVSFGFEVGLDVERERW